MFSGETDHALGLGFSVVCTICSVLLPLDLHVINDAIQGVVSQQKLKFKTHWVLHSLCPAFRQCVAKLLKKYMLQCNVHFLINVTFLLGSG